MKKPILICFVGIDGSGKTTQAKELFSWMQSEGIKAKYVWNRFEPRLISPVIRVGKAIFMPGKDIRKDYDRFVDSRGKIFQNKAMAAVFRYVYLAEKICLTWLKVAIHL